MSTTALDGVRVLDLATFVAAPFSAGLLGELGADVIKVEQPGAGDPLRELGDKVDGQGLWWSLEGRNRRSITCNLRTEAGQALIRDLVRHCAIVVENFRPGTLERWNLGFDRLRDVNPAIVLVRVSAYGQTGPYAPRPGFGRIAQAFGGLTYLSGDPDRPPVNPGSSTIADYAAGMFGAVSALAALRHAERTGEGQEVEISLFESIFRLTDCMPLEYDLLGTVRERNGSRSHAAPHNHYPTADGRWMAIACTNDRMFRRLAAAMGEPDWGTDLAFDTMGKRAERRDEVDARVAAFTAQHDQAALRVLLDEAEVPNGPINSVADCFADPQFIARGTLVDVEDELIGTVRQQAPVPRMSATPLRVARPAPGVGQHTDEVLREVLGADDARLADLRAADAI